MLLIIIAFASPQADIGPLTEMTEDSGAFKTFPVVSRRVPGFVMIQRRTLQRSGGGNPFRRDGRHGSENFNNRHESLTLS
jgi:hypothetical protein